jgi:hypothetical protein
MKTNTCCDQRITRKLAYGSSKPIMIAMSRWTGFREGIQIRGLESDGPETCVSRVANTARGL